MPKCIVEGCDFSSESTVKFIKHMVDEHEWTHKTALKLVEMEDNDGK